MDEQYLWYCCTLKQFDSFLNPGWYLRCNGIEFWYHEAVLHYTDLLPHSSSRAPPRGQGVPRHRVSPGQNRRYPSGWQREHPRDRQPRRTASRYRQRVWLAQFDGCKKETNPTIKNPTGSGVRFGSLGIQQSITTIITTIQISRSSDK